MWVKKTPLFTLFGDRAGCSVIFTTDNDNAGLQAKIQLAETLRNVGAKVKLFLMPKEFKYINEWFLADQKDLQ